MDKTPLPPIDNAADFVDALSRPQQKDQPVKWKFIEGRRMRDKYLGSVIVPKDVKESLPG